VHAITAGKLTTLPGVADTTEELALP
jgi:hypothetical protein